MRQMAASTVARAGVNFSSRTHAHRWLCSLQLPTGVYFLHLIGCSGRGRRQRSPQLQSHAHGWHRAAIAMFGVYFLHLDSARHRQHGHAHGASMPRQTVRMALMLILIQTESFRSSPCTPWTRARTFVLTSSVSVKSSSGFSTVSRETPTGRGPRASRRMRLLGLGVIRRIHA